MISLTKIPRMHFTALVGLYSSLPHVLTWTSVLLPADSAHTSEPCFLWSGLLSNHFLWLFNIYSCRLINESWIVNRMHRGSAVACLKYWVHFFIMIYLLWHQLRTHSYSLSEDLQPRVIFPPIWWLRHCLQRCKTLGYEAVSCLLVWIMSPLLTDVVPPKG